jgi:mannose-6-phosphate isomerase-like protein (cupin superfamily)
LVAALGTTALVLWGGYALMMFAPYGGFARTAFALCGGYARAAEAFVFPTVKPDPNPLRIQGPAGEAFTFVKTCRTTMNHYAMAEATIPSGTGPLPHVHHYTDEWFYFPEGGITIEMGEHPYPTIGFIPGKSAPKDTFHLIKTTPGSLFYGPRYIIHGFFNDTTQTHHMIFVWTPDDGIVDYFREVGQLIKDPANPPAIDPINKKLFVSQAPKYGINQSSSYNQYIDKVDRSPMPAMDEHRDELVKLLTTKFTTPLKTIIPCS